MQTDRQPELFNFEPKKQAPLIYIFYFVSNQAFFSKIFPKFAIRPKDLTKGLCLQISYRGGATKFQLPKVLNISSN